MKEEGIPFDVDHLFLDFRNYQTKLGIKSNENIQPVDFIYAFSFHGLW